VVSHIGCCKQQSVKMKKEQSSEAFPFVGQSFASGTLSLWSIFMVGAELGLGL